MDWHKSTVLWSNGLVEGRSNNKAPMDCPPDSIGTVRIEPPPYSLTKCLCANTTAEAPSAGSG